MSKNTLNQLTPEQQQIVISWIESDPDRKPGQPTAVTRVRNQFHIETTDAALEEFRFKWRLHRTFDDDNFKPENFDKLLTAMDALGNDSVRLQNEVYKMLCILAMKTKDLHLLIQIAKLDVKRGDLEQKKTVHAFHVQKSIDKAILANLQDLGSPTSPGLANLPIGSSLGALASPLPLGFSPSAAQPLTQPLSAVFAARVAELEKTQGPLSEAAKAEIAQSILDDTLKSVKRSA